MGLGFKDLSMGDGFNIVDDLTAKGSLPGGQISFYLTDGGDSEVTFGGYKPEQLASDIVWAPVKKESYWQVSIDDITFDNVPKGLCSGGCEVAVDTGTSMLAGPSDLVEKLSDMVAAKSDCSNMKTLPKLGFKIGNRVLNLKPDDYMDSAASDCSFSLMALDVPPPKGPLFIFGDPFLRRFVTIFDKTGPRVGFAVAKHSDDDESPEELIAHIGAAAGNPGKPSAYEENPAAVDLHLESGLMTPGDDNDHPDAKPPLPTPEPAPAAPAQATAEASDTMGRPDSNSATSSEVRPHVDSESVQNAVASPVDSTSSITAEFWHPSSAPAPMEVNAYENVLAGDSLKKSEDTMASEYAKLSSTDMASSENVKMDVDRSSAAAVTMPKVEGEISTENKNVDMDRSSADEYERVSAEYERQVVNRNRADTVAMPKADGYEKPASTDDSQMDRLTRDREVSQMTAGWTPSAASDTEVPQRSSQDEATFAGPQPYSSPAVEAGPAYSTASVAATSTYNMPTSGIDAYENLATDTKSSVDSVVDSSNAPVPNQYESLLYGKGSQEASSIDSPSKVQGHQNTLLSSDAVAPKVSEDMMFSGYGTDSSPKEDSSEPKPNSYESALFGQGRTDSPETLSRDTSNAAQVEEVPPQPSAGNVQADPNAWMAAFEDPAPSAPASTVQSASFTENAVSATSGDWSARFQNGLTDTIRSGVEEALKTDDSLYTAALETPEVAKQEAPKDDSVSNMQRLLVANTESLLQVKRARHLVTVKLHRSQ
jgi:hypothetical protein